MLARKSRSIREPDLLGAWLHGVAIRTARTAKARLDRRRRREVSKELVRVGWRSIVPVEPAVESAAESALDREQSEVLHEEIGRLPGPFRVPVVLCYFEGLTLDEAARRLEWPVGTVGSRLARAREKLRSALTRRGVALSLATLGTAMSAPSASALVPNSLCHATTKAAIRYAAGHPASEAVSISAITIAREVIRAMLLQKIRMMLLTVFFLSAVAMGAVYSTYSLAAQDKPESALAGPFQAATKVEHPNRTDPNRMLIVGRVLDPHGKPVANATVMAYAQPGGQSGHVIGHVQCNEAGSFQVDVPRTSSERHGSVGAGALAPGFGVGWIEIDPDARQLTVNITLQPEQVIHGRLFDLQGRPAREVTISVSSIRRILQPETSNARERSEGPVFGWDDVNALPGWPMPAVTDAEGRFTIHGIARGRRAVLDIRDSRYAQQFIRIETDDTPASKELTLALQPAQIITGRVTYADTGKPASHALLGTGSEKEGIGRRTGSTGFETDDDGRYRANPPPGDHFILYAYPPKGRPYLNITKDFDWPKGAVEHSVDLALPRGVVIHGKVTEHVSSDAIAGASLMFRAHAASDYGTGAQTEADGSYQLTVPPGPGHLAVRGPSNDYILQAIGYHMYFNGQPGRPRLYSNAFVLCDPKLGNGNPQINVVLRQGISAQGDVIGPDGQPVPDTWMISRVMLGPMSGAREAWRGSAHGSTRDGRFEINGLDPDSEVPVYFLEPRNKLGATYRIIDRTPFRGPDGPQHRRDFTVKPGETLDLGDILIEKPIG